MKKALPFIAIVLVVALGFVALKFLPKKAENTSQETSQEIKESAQEEKSFTGKVRDLISMGKSLKCTWVDDSDNSSVGYIKNKSYYGEVKQEGKDGFIIIKDNCMWSWEKGEATGFKMCFEPEESEEGLWGNMDDAQVEANYNCNPAVVSDSLFTPPADVNFANLEDLMKMGQ
ncbi:MAG: hypothetical protein ABIH88_02505 [Patescibacteria group bacterium]|nr:hypothetical protein [Patescibacteria group bacterium]